MPARGGTAPPLCLPGEITDSGVRAAVVVEQEVMSARLEPPKHRDRVPQVPQEVCPVFPVCPPLLDEFAVELEALLKQQHQELRSRLRDFVHGQKLHSGSKGSSGASSALRDCARGCERLPVATVNLAVEAGDTRTNSKISRRTSKGLSNSTGVVSADSNIALDEIFGLTTRPSHDKFRWASAELAHIEKKDDGYRGKLLRITGHWAYELTIACFIFSNSMFIAWETDTDARQVQAGKQQQAVHFEVLMYLFCAIFTADLALRLAAQGAYFFYSLDWKWNWFDIVVVFSSVLEILVSVMARETSWLSSASVLRVVRVVRLVRVARIGRALRSFMHFRDFRITISMLVDSVIPTMSHALIMAMMVMVFAIFFTDGVTAHLASVDDTDADLVKYFGSLSTSMATLYMAIFGGIDWEVAYEPLRELSTLYRWMFFAYVFFALLSMFNVISAMFVDQTMERSKSDRDFVVQTEMEGKREFLSTMEHLFEELDHDRSGTILLHELQNHIMDPQVNAYFRAIDLNVYKVKELFNLIDANKSGGIDRKEFAQGCTRLRGEAKELDVAILQYEVKALAEGMRNIGDLLKHSRERADNSREGMARYKARSHNSFA